MSLRSLLSWTTHDVAAAAWPAAGRHILASFDASSIVVYQAYRPSIARFAVEHGRFGGDDFSFSRMSWVKPNFLWMMYRSGWGTKEGQEVTLAVRVARRAFDGWLAAAVPSSFDPVRFPSRTDWESAVASSDVRLQWDPDHGPSGAPLARRALQLGLRGKTLADYAVDAIVSIDDISEDVAREHARLRSGETVCVPAERVYPVPPSP